MNLDRFNAEDIHEYRVYLSERRKRMSKEEAEREFKVRSEELRRAIWGSKPVAPKSVSAL